MKRNFDKPNNPDKQQSYKQNNSSSAYNRRIRTRDLMELTMSGSDCYRGRKKVNKRLTSSEKKDNRSKREKEARKRKRMEKAMQQTSEKEKLTNKNSTTRLVSSIFITTALSVAIALGYIKVREIREENRVKEYDEKLSAVTDIQSVVRSLIRNDERLRFDLADHGYEEFESHLNDEQEKQFEQQLAEIMILSHLDAEVKSGSIHKNDQGLILALMERVSAMDEETREAYDLMENAIVTLANNDVARKGEHIRREFFDNIKKAEDKLLKLDKWQHEDIRVCTILRTDLILREMSRIAKEEWDVPSIYDDHPDYPSTVQALCAQGFLNEAIVHHYFKPMKQRLSLAMFAENMGQVLTFRMMNESSMLDDIRQRVITKKAKRESVKHPRDLSDYQFRIQFLAADTFDEQAEFIAELADSEYDEYAGEGDHTEAKKHIREAARKHDMRANRHEKFMNGFLPKNPTTQQQNLRSLIKERLNDTKKKVPESREEYQPTKPKKLDPTIG